MTRPALSLVPPSDGAAPGPPAEPPLRGAFGSLLRRYRLIAGLSQDELAERAGLSTRGISDLERGLRRTPHPATLRRLADALGLDTDRRAALLEASLPGLSTEDSAERPLGSAESLVLLAEAVLAALGRQQTTAGATCRCQHTSGQQSAISLLTADR